MAHVTLPLSPAFSAAAKRMQHVAFSIQLGHVAPCRPGLATWRLMGHVTLPWSQAFSAAAKRMQHVAYSIQLGHVAPCRAGLAKRTRLVQHGGQTHATCCAMLLPFGLGIRQLPLLPRDQWRGHSCAALQLFKSFSLREKANVLLFADLLVLSCAPRPAGTRWKNLFFSFGRLPFALAE